VFEEIEFQGRWWLPDEEDNQITGCLKITPYSEAILELQGSFDDDFSGAAEFSPSILLGIANNGRLITLNDCILTNRTDSSYGYPTLRLFVHRVFVGIHLNKAEEITFDRITVRYLHFHEWFNGHNFKVERKYKPYKIFIQYEQLQPLKFNYNDCAVEIGTGWSLQESSSTVTLTEDAWIRFDSQRDRPLNDFFTLVHHFQNFLSLAMSMPTFPTQVIGQTGKSKRVAEGKELYTPIDIYYPAIGWTSEPKKTHSFEMLFTLPNVKDLLEVYFANWMSKAEQFKPVHDLYFGSLYKPDQYVESTFLSLAQAIETYHRRRVGGKYQSDEEYRENLYKKFVEAIPTEIDAGFKRSLIDGKLKYANEYSLRKRLGELAARISANLPIPFLSAKALEKAFVEKVCDTRNYLTHYDPELKEKAAQGEELYDLTIKLKAIIEICLLEDLGFNFMTIKEIFTNNRKYRHIMRWN